MHPDVARLLDLQELDREALELQEQLNHYPTIWEQVKKKVGGKKSTLDTAEKTLDRHQKDRKRVEQKLRLFSEDLRKNQALQSKVKTPREYEAITKQIDALRVRISQLEEQAVHLLERDDEVNAAVVAAKAEMEKAQELYNSEKARIRGQFNEKKARLDHIAVERKEAAAGISAEALDTYERIKVRWPGSAIVSVRGGSCTGCNFQLLSGVLVSMHSSEQLHFCDTCDRILSHDENYVPAAQHAAS